VVVVVAASALKVVATPLQDALVVVVQQTNYALVAQVVLQPDFAQVV